MKTLIPVLLALLLLAHAHDPKPKPPARAPSSDYVVKLEQMKKLDAGVGETIYLLNGESHVSAAPRRRPATAYA